MKILDSIRLTPILVLSGLMVVLANPLDAQTASRDELLGEQFLRLINSTPLPTSDEEDELVKLLKARHNVALEGLNESYRDFGNNVVQVDVVFDAGRRLVDSRLDLASTPEEKLTVYNEVLAILVELEGIYEHRAKLLGGGESDVIRIRFARLTTEVDILKAKREAMSVSKESN